MITQKSRGSLTYLPGRRGIGCSGPPDHDPTVQIETVHDLISPIRDRSGGRGQKGRGSGGGLAGAELPRRSSAGVHQSGASGLGLGRGWAKEHRRDTCNPPVHSGRRIGARSGLAAVQGGASSPASRANAIPAPTWLVFVTGMLCVILQSYSGSQIRTAVSRAEHPPWHGGAAELR